MQLRTLGLSPKLVADLLTSIVAFLLTHYAIELDPVLSAAIAKGIGAVAAYFAPPAPVLPLTDHATIPPDQVDQAEVVV